MSSNEESWRVGIVVVAAGRGERLGADCRKALVPLSGRPLLMHCLERFQEARDLVTSVVVVAHEGDLHDMQSGRWAKDLTDRGVDAIVLGGARRQDSVLAGLEALDPSVEVALVHDAARPFVHPELIRRLVSAARETVGVLPVVPVTSTVKKVRSDRVEATIDRATLRLAQTPQGGRRRELIAALTHARDTASDVTDEAQALEASGHDIKCVFDSPWNFKVTTPEDLALAELVAERRLWENSF